MCYSALVKAEWQTYLRYGGRLGLKQFAKLYAERIDSGAIVPKALDAWFANPTTDEERQICELIERFKDLKIAQWEQERLEQVVRQGKAKAKLEVKRTKTAEEELRISTKLIAQYDRWITNIQSNEPASPRARIYSDQYAPVIVVQDGERVVLPMRYHCLPEGKPAFFDKKYPGTYNARRDSLENYWKDVFGFTHGIIIATAFYESVDREGKKVELRFKPQTGQQLFLACLWSRWVGKDGKELYSFAAITEDPPPEVEAAGHDRCIIPIKEEHIEAWLNPGGDLQRAYEILDDKERPYYEHEVVPRGMDAEGR